MNEPAAQHDVIIVGAGPTGLTLANLLGRAGVDVLLVERNPDTVQEPRAVSIDDEALRTMQAAGLADAVVADVALDYGIHYVDRRGRVFATVEPKTREYGWPRRNAFVQPALEATLRRGLARFANVTALFGALCEEVAEQTDDVHATIVFQDGRPCVARARYLVGCDGARSLVRHTIGATLPGSTYAERWLIVDLASTRDPFRQTRVICDPARPCISLPGPRGLRRYEFMLQDGESEEEAVSPAFVRRLLATVGPDADETVARRRVYTFHARVADRWNTRRVFLAGDAAHLSPPFAGQGMNSGVRDAHNLAWKLAAVLTGRFGEAILDSYAIERAPHARALIELAIRIGRVMAPRSTLQAALVQRAFRALRAMPALQSYVAQMKFKPKPFLRQGFRARRDPLGVVGRMLPQPLVEPLPGRSVPLDDLLGSGLALVACGPRAAVTLAVARQRCTGIDAVIAVLPRDYNPPPGSDDQVVRELDGLMAGFVGHGSDALLLVRPDRYVAAAVRVETKLEDALAELIQHRVELAHLGGAPEPGRRRRCQEAA